MKIYECPKCGQKIKYIADGDEDETTKRMRIISYTILVIVGATTVLLMKLLGG